MTLQISLEYAPSYEPVEKLQQFILWRGGRADVVAPPLQIPSDMLGRRAPASHPPRPPSEMPQYFQQAPSASPSTPPRSQSLSQPIFKTRSEADLRFREGSFLTADDAD